jgi:hypothetical protein
LCVFDVEVLTNLAGMEELAFSKGQLAGGKE